MILNWIPESSNTEIANVPGGILVFRTYNSSLFSRMINSTPSASTTAGLVFVPDVVLASKDKSNKLLSSAQFEKLKDDGWKKV